MLVISTSSSSISPISIPNRCWRTTLPNFNGIQIYFLLQSVYEPASTGVGVKVFWESVLSWWAVRLNGDANGSAPLRWNSLCRETKFSICHCWRVLFHFILLCISLCIYEGNVVCLGYRCGSFAGLPVAPLGPETETSWSISKSAYHGNLGS